MAEEVGALGWREARDNIAKRVPKRRDGSHSLVTTVELAIMLGWQEKPHPSAEKPTRGHSLICSIKWRAC
jgi:hypothetical protein